ncbi:hypothetical protein [Actinacidiphila glaucinigra]|uniref:hypothetical protein n=1 Tax=Actinacidiphila glaucinigra TaxID=235986 RepID=UPI00367236E9
MDIRVKTFVAEACLRIGAVVEGLGFTGPEVDEDRHDIYPRAMRVRYHRADVSIQTRLILSFAGEDHVDTELAWSAEIPHEVRRVRVGRHTAHTGHQMRRALDRQAQAIPDLLGTENPTG